MPIRPSSSVVVNFSLKMLISQKLPDNFFSFFVYSFIRKVPMFCINIDLIWIFIKVILKGQKGQIWLIFYLEAIFSKTVWYLFLYLCRKLHKEGTNVLSKDGFDWITLKVIFKGPKGPKRVKFGCFDTFCQFSQKPSDNFSLFLVYASWGWYWSTVKRWISLNYSKGHFQGRKGQI